MQLDRNNPYSAIPQLQKQINELRKTADSAVIAKLQEELDAIGRKVDSLSSSESGLNEAQVRAIVDSYNYLSKALADSSYVPVDKMITAQDIQNLFSETELDRTLMTLFDRVRGVVESYGYATIDYTEAKYLKIADSMNAEIIDSIFDEAELSATLSLIFD